jgi:flagellar biosynthesis/type III secretory pathway protein FliH
MAKSCMEAMIGEPRLAITVHSRLAPALEHTLQSLSARSQEAAHCIVTGDESMAVADCRIEWKYGAMERHTGALWQQVEQVVASMVSSAARTTEAQIAPLEQTLPPTHAKE